MQLRKLGLAEACADHHTLSQLGREPGCGREGKLETVNPVPHDFVPIMTGRGARGWVGLVSAGLWGPRASPT